MHTTAGERAASIGALAGRPRGCSRRAADWSSRASTSTDISEARIWERLRRHVGVEIEMAARCGYFWPAEMADFR